MSKKLDFREYECELIRVVDGDTIDCWIDLGFKTRLKKRVRYMGLDTWESRTRDLEEKKKGLAAKARNKELLEQGVFNIKDAFTIEQLNEDSVLSIESVFPNFIDINLSSDEARFFLNGVKIKHQKHPDAIYKIFSDKGVFLGLGEVNDSILKLKQLV